MHEFIIYNRETGFNFMMADSIKDAEANVGPNVVVLDQSEIIQGIIGEERARILVD